VSSLVSVVIIAGDPSGDIHAAPVIRELKKLYPHISVWGIGGPHMEKEGFCPILPFTPFNKMGFWEVITHIGFFLAAKKMLLREIEKRRPDCVLCVDYPGFNMPVMKEVRKLSIPVVWYIAPMVWAWKHKRAITMGQQASEIACIFPFEVKYFDKYTKRVHFVGNPTVEDFCTNVVSVNTSMEERNRTIAIIPGSRRQEIVKMLPVMLDAFRQLKKEYPDLKAEVSCFNLVSKSLYEITSHYDSVTLTTKSLREMASSSFLAIVKSGTATLEVALTGTPMVIAYKTSPLTYALAKKLVKIKFIGLPNIIADQCIVPECIQDDMNPDLLASSLSRFITDKKYYDTTVENLIKLRELLGAKKPSAFVASLIEGQITKSM
jgi:lipid-A-disaccharide synthase